MPFPRRAGLGLALLLSGCSLDPQSLASLFTPPTSTRGARPSAAPGTPNPGSDFNIPAARTTVVAIGKDGKRTVIQGGAALPSGVASGPALPAQPASGPAAPVASVAPAVVAPAEGTPILTPEGAVSPEAKKLLVGLAEWEGELSAALEALLAKAEVAQALDPRPELVEGLPALASPAPYRLSQFGIGLGAGGLSLGGPEASAPEGLAADFVAPVRANRAGELLKALAKRATLALDRGEDGRLAPRLEVKVGGEEVPDGRARGLSLSLQRSVGTSLLVRYEVAAKGAEGAVLLERRLAVVAGVLTHEVSGSIGEVLVAYQRAKGGLGGGQLSGALRAAFRFALAGPPPAGATPPAAQGGAPLPIAASPSPGPSAAPERAPFDPFIPQL